MGLGAERILALPKGMRRSLTRPRARPATARSESRTLTRNPHRARLEGLRTRSMRRFRNLSTALCW